MMMVDVLALLMLVNNVGIVDGDHCVYNCC